MPVFRSRRKLQPALSRGQPSGRRAPAWQAPLFLVAALMLIVLGRIDPQLLDPIRAPLAAVSAPILGETHAMFSTLKRGLAEARSALDAARELREVRAENARLAALAARAAELERENRRLQQMARFVGTVQPSLQSARVIATATGPLADTARIDAGRQAGLAVGDLVLASGSLLGRLIEVGSQSATVIRLSDRASRVPVLIGGSRAQAVLAGQGAGHVKLEFLEAAGAISQADLVVTSDIGGIYPRALSIGVLAREGHDWTVTLAAEQDDLALVAVLGRDPLSWRQQAAAPDLGGGRR